MFHVGQKVVSVDADRTLYCGGSELIKGAVYTVAGPGRACPSTVAISQRRWADAGLIHLAEVVRGPCPACGGRAPFSAMRFRPITERKTDISELKKLCEPTPAKSVEVVP